MIFDTHIHLNDEKYTNLDILIKEAKELGINAFLCIGYDLESSKKAIEIASKFDNVFASVGVIPTEHKQYNDDTINEYCTTLVNAAEKGAMFDARVFNIPKEEVCNLIYWRQLDATRNSIQMVGQANFSHKELQNKSCNMIQEMLFAEKGINWNDYPTYLKRGSCCIKTTIQNPNVDIKDGAYPKSVWMIDLDIPIFKGDGRNYIDKLVFIGE